MANGTYYNARELPTVNPQETCDDAIRRQDVLDLAEKGILISNGNYKKVCKVIEDLPPVNPVKIGHWIKAYLTDTGDIDGQCSECGFIHKFIDGHTAQYNYCPSCGAKLQEDKE